MTSTPDTTKIPRVKSILFAVAAITAVELTGAASALADTGKHFCVDVNRVQSTEVLNDHQILFHLYGNVNGKKDWVNTLQSQCTTLTRSDGFVWDSSIAKYCSNEDTIRVIRTGEVCLLGEFVPYEKPAKPS